ncbi:MULTISPECIES: amidohydrolase family protein [Actinosynnema]|uniref:amidohydrolase family protein n=1 Tax=Actinosynnema TaxID=40566 RepID=UPI0020A2B161|nr:amidohydrolase family protein [Actinosynnema pretiosum]
MRGAAAAGGVALVGPPGLAGAQDSGSPGALRRFTATEGTNITAALSPDGRTIAIDLYTRIWLLPASGGRARPLTGPEQDATRPHFAPDGRSLVFQSYRDGNFHLWTINVDGTGLRKRTSGPSDHREPRFSPDGRSIAYAGDAGATGYDLWLLDLATGRTTRLTDGPTDDGEPAFSADGRHLVCTADGTAIDRIAVEDRTRTRLVHPVTGTRVLAPGLTPDGRLVHTAFAGPTTSLVVDGRVVVADEDLFGSSPQWLGAALLHTADGGLRVRDLTTGATRAIPFEATVEYAPHTDRPAARPVDRRSGPVRGIASPVLSPDGRSAAFRALGALWLLPLDGGRPRALVDDGSFASDPDWYPDGSALVYTSDRTGTPALWRHDPATGVDTRLADLPGAQLTPRVAPDGERIAFQDADGATWVLSGGVATQVLPALFQPGRPTWSPDGRTLALAAVKPFSQRYREGTNQVLTVALDTGEVRYAEPLPGKSLSTRGDDGPVWSPDGRWLALVVESALWVVPVDARGAVTGRARRIAAGPADAPSWSGDSKTLLHLENGALVRTGLDGRARRSGVPLTWARPRAGGRKVLRAGALWDGRAGTLRRAADVLINGDRVESVHDRRAWPGLEVVDASRFTVLPGLIDAHNHWHLRGRQWGDRQGRLWLAYGITTTRSPGDPAYQMVETREALDAGKRIGPRYLATGEAVDGGRVYYNFMRTTTSPEQVDLELSRAIALEYDLIKTYVRLPVDLQRRAVDLAHRAGLPLTSHYLYPAVGIGMDGMEHVGATNRLGYSHTNSRLGRGYRDVTGLFAASGMSITTTLFQSAVLHGDDPSLVHDPRTTALFPPWEHQRFVQEAEGYAQDTPANRQTREVLRGNAATLLAVHRGGGLVLGGTDAPLDKIAVGLHQNLRGLVAHGFTPHEALTTVTANPARWLGLADRIGVVKPGAWADLIGVEGDPLRDIRTVANTRLVVTGGVVRTPEELIGPFAESHSASEGATPVGEPLPSVNPDLFWWHGEPEWSVHLCH